jgi:hypothetical protein
LKRKVFSSFTLAVPAAAQLGPKAQTIGVEERCFHPPLRTALRTVVAGAALLCLMAASQLAVNSGLTLLDREISASFVRGIIR